jgi:uncharacterized protein (TIGR02118 family)
MVKLMALLKRKAGLSLEEFQRYYETHHAPLAVRIAAMGHDYRRNYLRSMRKAGVEVDGVMPFDVITEVWFKDRAAYEAFSASMKQPEIRQQIVADEERFMDRDASQIFIVEENCSPGSSETR